MLRGIFTTLAHSTLPTLLTYYLYLIPYHHFYHLYHLLNDQVLRGIFTTLALAVVAAVAFGLISMQVGRLPPPSPPPPPSPHIIYSIPSN